MTMRRFDVAIVGAGPAGTASAIGLAGSGYSVALIDKDAFPRDKLCGDFISPINWPIFRELGIDREILSLAHDKITRFRITACSGEQAETRLLPEENPDHFGLGLSRWSFDHLLVQQAQRKGAAVLQGCRVKLLQREAGAWRLGLDHSGDSREIRASIVIGADGRNSWLAHRLELARAAETQGRSVGFQFQLQAAHTSKGRIEIHLFPGGYAGLAELGDDSLTLALAVEKEKLPHERQAEFVWESLLPQNPYLKEVLQHSKRVGATRSTYPVYFRPRRCFADRVLFVGDAARVNEPVSGEGIYFAMKSGLLAADTVDEAFRTHDFSAATLAVYARHCRQIFRLRRRINWFMRGLIYRPQLLAPLIRFSAQRRRLLDSLVHTVCTPEPAR